MAGAEKMLKEKILKKSRKYSMVLVPFIWFISSLLIVFSTYERVTAPLICALTGALTPLSAIAVAVGGLFGFLATGEIFDNGFIVCSLILITVGKWFVRGDSSDKSSAFITFISMAFSGITFGLVIASDFRQTAINILYAFICPAAIYFIVQAKEILLHISSISADRKSLTALAVVFLLGGAVICGMEVYFINIGVILLTLVILCSCRFFGCRGGVICGVLTTCAVLIGNTELADETIFFGLAGLLAGLVSAFSRITIATVFSGTVLLGQLALGMNDSSFFLQSDIILSSVCFLLIPERFVTKGGRICAGAVSDSSDYLSKEMDFAAKSLSDIRENINDIMNAFAARQKAPDNVRKVSDRVCSKCRSKLECWEKKFELTNEAFISYDRKNIFPVNFECSNRTGVTEEFERCRRELAVSKMLTAKLTENRNLIFSQMKASEEIVASLSAKLSMNISESMSAVLNRTLDKYDIKFNSAVVFSNDEKRLVAEIYCPENVKIDHDELCSILSCELSIPFEYSQPFSSSGETRLRFNQQTKYHLEATQFQLSAKEGDVCGDTCGYFTDGLGFAYIYLSDGMGSGSSAAINSKLTAKLFKRLIRLGMSCDGAVKMVNSVMLTKSDDESFATLDIAKINLETGGVTLYKSGASATLIKYGEAVMMFSFPSNPVGIIPDMKMSEKSCSFDEGDVLVMMSDGVPETSYKYIKEQLVTDTPLAELSENICRFSRKITLKNHTDDITAVGVKLVKNSNNMQKNC